MKTVLITGASGGIGSAAARLFHQAGYRVILHYFRGEETAVSLHNELPNSELFRADLSDRSQVRLLAEAFPETDVLINNAAVDLFSLFDLVTEQQEKELYSVNLEAPLLLSRILLKGMLERQSGCILNISSYFGEIGGSCEVDYSVAKAALIGFTKALSKEIGPSNIRINCVCPGVINTKMNDRLSVDEMDALIDDIPLERLGNPDEVAKLLLYLASDDASYITGSVFDINGGIL